ncbi:hypothetical protein fugu_018155 [Takifugu bimaculatus]|uniref:Uncharacterized protein n=1 Tax=Takifugu bimaculatus TaxID=433685 RepID=A0A4Z2BKA3_9TELE|nr:hypothetical protein fugu_018155 [Takifugu bimaculatus]
MFPLQRCRGRVNQPGFHLLSMILLRRAPASCSASKYLKKERERSQSRAEPHVLDSRRQEHTQTLIPSILFATEFLHFNYLAAVGIQGFSLQMPPSPIGATFSAKSTKKRFFLRVPL